MAKKIWIACFATYTLSPKKKKPNEFQHLQSSITCMEKSSWLQSPFQISGNTQIKMYYFNTRMIEHRRDGRPTMSRQSIQITQEKKTERKKKKQKQLLRFKSKCKPKPQWLTCWLIMTRHLPWLSEVTSPNHSDSAAASYPSYPCGLPGLSWFLNSFLLCLIIFFSPSLLDQALLFMSLLF